MAKRHVSIRGGEWTDPATWVQRRVPTSADDVILPWGSGTLVVNESATIGSFAVLGHRRFRLRVAEWFWRTVRRERWPW